MSIETEFRILLVYLLLMRWGIAWYFRNPIATKRTEFIHDVRVRDARRIAWSLFLVPAGLATVLSEIFSTTVEIPQAGRWLMVAVAVVCLLMYFWSRRVAAQTKDTTTSAQEEVFELYQTAPYRVLRHPLETADTVFMIALGIISASVATFFGSLIATAILFLVAVPRRESSLAAIFGSDAQLLTKGFGMPKLKSAEYQVPTRFNLTAIIGLITILSLLFGSLNFAKARFDVHPIAYLFVAGQILAICIGQMFFQTAPRVASVLVGAILLPTFVAISIELSDANVSDAGWFIAMVSSAVLGAATGYCIGTLAAGFFLVTDWLEQWFVRDRRKPEPETSKNDEHRGTRGQGDLAEPAAQDRNPQ